MGAEVIITLSGGAPWGFRLQGGVEHQKPLQVAKVRKRSKACRAGLREADELVSINEQPCAALSHAQAMNLIDSSPGMLHIRVRRAPAAFQSVVLVTRAPSPRIDKEYRAALRAMSPNHSHHAPVREVHRSRSTLTSGLTSPPGSEAYYGETDSDADVAGYERQRRQKRRSPSNSNPGKPTGRTSPEEPANVPLVSPERAKEALMLGSRDKLVPMVGPVNKPIDDELTTTYMEKAKQAKLNRGDTLQDKQVKEAKSKCRTIASLLTDAPNPHSKGVLMFKKRRQRSKKYTLTSFGSVDEDRCQDSQEEEDGVLPGSESEIDEDGFSSLPDPTWDSDYLDMLEKRATAGIEGRGDGAEDAPSPGLSDTAGKGAQLFEQQRKRVAEHAKKAEAAKPQVPPQSQASLPPVTPKPATVSVTVLTSLAQPAETPLPELPVSNVLNRTARPFTPGFISIRAATAPVTFRPPVTKTAQLLSPQSSIPQGSLALTPEAPVTYNPPSLSTCVQTMQSMPTITTVHRNSFPTVTSVPVPSIPPAPQVPAVPAPGPPASQIPVSVDQVIPVSPLQTPVAQPPLQSSMAPLAQVSVVSQSETVAPTPVPVSTNRTGILLEARRRSGKPKPMFNVPDVKKNSPNPELLSMVQNLDDRYSRYKYGQPPIENIYDDVPPPVAPKPRVVHEVPQILQAGGKGAQLFAKRQSRMGRYVVDAPPEAPYQKEGAMHSAVQPLGSSLNPSQWKYSPNVRAPPPIGYNPLLAPSIPTGPQRDINKPDNRGRGSSPREGIKALDFMRRQPYQLNSAMFNYGGSAANLSIPLKTARVYEIKRFSTPTPMSGPSLAPKVIAPRSATSLGEPGPPSLPKFSFQSAPELSILASLPPLKSNPIQAPKPRFVATKGGVQPRVWRPGAI
uniref:Synaptopodin 2-like protein n=1 Tax=Amphilophus citrinellus TaxID=61819 RepID=A0A3Q0RU31_AMPCI